MSNTQAEIRTVTLAVQGMTCGSCEARIRGAVAALPGTGPTTINRTTGQVTVASTRAEGDDRAIAEAITAAGYLATLA